MGYNCKNYKTDGGDTTVIGGKLVIEEGAQIEGLPAASFKQGAAVADAAGAAPTAAEFKALLDSLRGAGIIATAEAEG